MAISRARAVLHDRMQRLDSAEQSIRDAMQLTFLLPDVHAMLDQAFGRLASHQRDLVRAYDRLDQHEAETGVDPFALDPEICEQLAALAPGRAELAHVERRRAAA